jgi:hypothetical protein
MNPTAVVNPTVRPLARPVANRAEPVETAVAAEPTLLETIRALEQRTAEVEQSAAAMRAELAQVIEHVANTPIVIYYIAGERYEITSADIEAVRRRLIKPRAAETLRELALVDKMTERDKHLTRAEVAERFLQELHEIRSAVVSSDFAINDEREAAIHD